MPLTESQRNRLFEELDKIGWRKRDNFLYAPNETVWLLVSEPWSGDLLDFHERMIGRLERIKNNGGRNNADDDVTGLIQVLKAMLDSN
jgi:hypothetical protein